MTIIYFTKILMFVRNKAYLYPKHTILDLKWLLTLPYPKRKRKEQSKPQQQQKVGGGSPMQSCTFEIWHILCYIKQLVISFGSFPHNEQDVWRYFPVKKLKCIITASLIDLIILDCATDLCPTLVVFLEHGQKIATGWKVTNT